MALIDVVYEAARMTHQLCDVQVATAAMYQTVVEKQRLQPFRGFLNALNQSHPV